MLAKSTFHLPLRIARGGGVALVVQVLAPAQAQLQLHPPILEVNLQGNQRVALAAHQAAELADLAFMQEQLFGAKRVAVGEAALLIGADVHAFGKHFRPTHHGKALLEIHPALTHALDLGALEAKAAFVGFLHEVIVIRLFVLRYRLDPPLVRHGGNLLSRSFPQHAIITRPRIKVQALANGKAVAYNVPIPIGRGGFRAGHDSKHGAARA